jgi:hypothetical protein
MGAALVAFCLLAGDLGGQSTAVSASGSLETPGEPAFVPGFLALQASVASELRAGVAPVLPGADSQSFVAEILIPRLALELRNPGLVFLSWYAPRIFWEDPHPSSTSGTLVLHTLGLSLEARASRDVSMTASGSGSIGASDYTTVSQVLGTVQATLPPTVDLAAVNGQAKVVWKLTPRWGLSLAGLVSHWQWLDIPATVAPATVTGQTLVSGEPAVGVLLTARDALGLGVAFGWVSYTYDAGAFADAGAFTISPATTWKRRIDRSVDLSVKLGLSYAQALGSPPPGAVPLLGIGRTQAVSPIGSADIVVRLARRNETMFLGRASAGVDYYLDPVLGIAVPRGSTGVELTALSVPSWTTTLRGDFATALQSVPVSPTQVPPDETAFSLSVSVRRRVTENFYAEVGGQWTNRGPTLDTPDFRFDQRQYWAYLSLTATTRPVPRPALPK